MGIKWKKSKLAGVEFYQHEERKHGIKFDRYYRARFMSRGKQHNIGFGWGTEGWTSKNVFIKLQEFKNNAKSGIGPTSLKEEQSIRESEKAEAKRLKDVEDKENITFSNFYINQYAPVAQKDKKEDTIRAEKAYFNTWLNPELGHLPFKKIKPFNLEKVKKNMFDAGRAPRTVQYCLAVFRQVWNTAKIHEIVQTDSPTQKVKLPKFDNKRLRFLNREEADGLFKELNIRSKQLHNIALLSLHTGMRAGEIFNLTWSDVDLENDVLTIRDSKSGKTRYSYLTTDTKTMLKQLSHKNREGIVFKNRNGEKINEISNAFLRAVNKMGCNNGYQDPRQKVSFHTLRHTFASWHVQNGTDLYTVKELLGHHSIQLTERYSHLKPDGLKKATQDFDKKLWLC